MNDELTHWQSELDEASIAELQWALDNRKPAGEGVATFVVSVACANAVEDAMAGGEAVPDPAPRPPDPEPPHDFTEVIDLVVDSAPHWEKVVKSPGGNKLIAIRFVAEPTPGDGTSYAGTQSADSNYPNGAIWKVGLSTAKGEFPPGVWSSEGQGAKLTWYVGENPLPDVLPTLEAGREYWLNYTTRDKPIDARFQVIRNATE